MLLLTLNVASCRLRARLFSPQRDCGQRLNPFPVVRMFMSRMPAEQIKTMMLDRKHTVMEVLVTLAVVAAVKLQLHRGKKTLYILCEYVLMQDAENSAGYYKM